MPTTKKINANGTEISIILQGNENDYICLNDMARYKEIMRMTEEQLKVLNDQNTEYRFKKLTSGTEITND